MASICSLSLILLAFRVTSGFSGIKRASLPNDSDGEARSHGPDASGARLLDRATSKTVASVRRRLSLNALPARAPPASLESNRVRFLHFRKDPLDQLCADGRALGLNVRDRERTVLAPHGHSNQITLTHYSFFITYS